MLDFLFMSVTQSKRGRPPWHTEEDREKIRAWIAEGLSYEKIGEIFGRSGHGIRLIAIQYNLGISLDSQRMTNPESFYPPKEEDDPNYGLCRCGCGQRTSLARKTDNSRGRIKGRPLPYVFGHQPQPGRPLSYDPDTTTKICIFCKESFTRNNCSARMTEDEWSKRLWCSWECRENNTYRIVQTQCLCCEDRLVSCGGFCKLCYEWLRGRGALYSDNQKSWISCYRTFKLLRDNKIWGFPNRSKTDLTKLTQKEQVIIINSIKNSYQQLEGVY